METVKLEMTFEQLELLLDVVYSTDVEDLYEENTPEEVLENRDQMLQDIHRLLLRKLG
jgi:hypothetical protein